MYYPYFYQVAGIFVSLFLREGVQMPRLDLQELVKNPAVIESGRIKKQRLIVAMSNTQVFGI